MVWEKSSDEKVICSSIAMLQERFRQLEKVKEMREERELLKLISSSINNHHQCNPFYHDQSYPITSSHVHEDPNSNFLFLSEIMFPTRPLDSDELLSLSLWPSSSQMKNNNHADSYWDINTKNLTSKPSWLNDVPLASPSLIKKIDESSFVCSEVDTTLHL